MVKKNFKLEKSKMDVTENEKVMNRKSERVAMDLNEFQQRVSKTAQELFEKSGHIPGRDMDNWLEAERIIKSETAVRK